MLSDVSAIFARLHGKKWQYARQLLFFRIGSKKPNARRLPVPAFLCIIAMPFFYSISEGISMGIITYVAINLITGKAKEKKISALMYVLAVLFILKYIFL